MSDFTPKTGQNIFRDVTTDPVTGQPHKVKVCGPWLQIDTDVPIELPEPGMHVRLRVNAGNKYALIRGHDSDALYYVTGTSYQNLGRVMGDYAACFGADGSVQAQRDTSRPDYAGEGIHHVDPDGRWVMNNDPELNPSIDGLKLFQRDMAGAYTVGKSDALTNSGVSRLGPDGWWHFPQYTQYPPFVNAQGWVAIQGSHWQMTPEPDAVPWVRAIAPAPVPVPVPAPAPAPVKPPPVVVTPVDPYPCRELEAQLAERTQALATAEAANAQLTETIQARDEELKQTKAQQAKVNAAIQKLPEWARRLVEI